MFLLFNDAQFGNVRLKFAFSDCQHRATEPSAHKLTRSAKTHYSRAQECEADLTSQPAHDCRVRHGPGSCQAQRDTVEGDHDQRHKREKRRRYEQQVRDVEGTIICSAGFQHCGRNKPLFNCCNLQAHCSTIGEENRTNLRRCDKSCGLPAAAVSCTTEVRHYTVAWFKKSAIRLPRPRTSLFLSSPLYLAASAYNSSISIWAEFLFIFTPSFYITNLFW